MVKESEHRDTEFDMFVLFNPMPDFQLKRSTQVLHQVCVSPCICISISSLYKWDMLAACVR